MFKILKNKFFLAGIVIVILIGGYFIYKNISSKEQSFYTLSQVRRGSIEKIISGTGNIVANESFEIKSKISGKVIYLPFKEGNLVRKGDLLLKLDTSDLEKQIRDLEFNLESQKINLQKLIQRKEQIERGDDLRKINESYLNTVSDFINKFSVYYDSVNKIYFNKDFERIDYAYNNLEYYLSYFFKDYENQSRKIKDELVNLKNFYLDTSGQFNLLKIDPIKIDKSFVEDLYKLNSDYLNIIKFVLDKIRTIKENAILSQQTHVYQDVINNHLDELNTIYSELVNYLNNFGDYKNKINSYYDNLTNLDLDIKNSEISLKQLEAKIRDLKDSLEDYEIYSPVTGYISQLNVKINDNISPSTNLMVIDSTDKIAEIKLNEVDVAEIKVGNDAILTFDALPNLQLKGKVIYIDPIGEVSQGVVSYNVKIAFEDNFQVKIGMTVNADIITQTKRNVLIVPNQAVKTMGSRKYVEIPDGKDLVVLNQRNNGNNIFNLRNNTTTNWAREEEMTININLNYMPQIKFIRVGLNDERNTEILEGLDEGDWIIVRSSTNNQIVSDNQQQGLFQRLFPQPRRFIRSPGIRQ